MTPEEFEQGLAKAAQIQRNAGWSEESIDSYAREVREMAGGEYGCLISVGAGLAQDNSRHGVPSKKRRVPCGECPFRADANLSYDADAHERLAEGLEPSCHKIAGVSEIFNDPCPTDQTICVGFVRWTHGEQGYSKPGMATS